MNTEISNAVFEAAPDAIFIVDTEGIILHVNKKVMVLFGYHPDDLIGRKIEILIPSHLAVKHKAYREVYAMKPVPREMGATHDLKAKRKDGTEFFADVSIAPIIVNNQHLISATVRDVSDKRLLTAQLNEALDNLKNKNVELEHFAYQASHDLQEPLRTITSLVDMLILEYEGRLDENADQYLKYISEATARMKNLIHGLLDYSRAGRDTELETVNCAEVVATIRKDLDLVIKESGTTIIMGDLPHIQAKEMDIHLLFQNLISNAIKFRLPDVKPVITIQAVNQDAFFLISVSDNGIGLDEEHYQKIFEIFKRLHSHTAYKGTGIGLSVCKKIVEHYGGKIWVESVLLKGSTFWFTIPVFTQ